VNRELPAGILSTKDALDDGNAYGSGVAAAARPEIRRSAVIVKSEALSEALAEDLAPRGIDLRGSVGGSVMFRAGLAW
jgi:hypothetical protein